MTTVEAIEEGRAASMRRDWRRAVTLFMQGDRHVGLDADDLVELAVALRMIGSDATSHDVWARAHTAHLAAGATEQAARSAFWLAFALFSHGEMARGGAWLARAQRLIEVDSDSVVSGYLLIPAAIMHSEQRDSATALDMFGEAERIGQRHSETTLVAMARLGRGRALIRMGRTAEGRALLDEVMVAVTAGEVLAFVVGDVYCSVIEACQELFDLRRAREWTSALTHWCATQPDLVPYRGQCLVHRAQIMTLHGAWGDALDETRHACERLSQPEDRGAIGAAFYQQGEILRLQGNPGAAEEAYREASHRGHTPQPGLALLRLGRRQVDTAYTSIGRALDDANDATARARLLPAYIEIAIAAGDLASAGAAARELTTLADVLDAPLLGAAALHATGATELAGGDPLAASHSLRRAWSAWRELEAPYEAARARVLIGLAYRAQADEDAAEMELDAAQWVFQQMGAASDATAVAELMHPPGVDEPDRSAAWRGLTPRELEVLRQVASGKTNRAIADHLVLSEKTVARHVSNIFTKLGLSSRSAATAYAYQQNLVDRST
jgi:DNA-binding CsgD family transcriptional regulator